MFDNAELERVDRHIAGAMRRNARLRREIAHRQFDGSDLTCATSLLEAFVITLNSMVDRWSQIMKDLGR